VANTKVQSEQIEDGSITADKLADGTIVAAELANNAVVTAAINADAVTGAKIADDAIDSEHYTDGSIDTAHIADAQITVAKMAANSVDSDQYVDGSIDTVHLGDLQVTTAKIANGNISTAKIADNAVTSAKIDTNIDIAGTFDVTGATTLDAGLTVGAGTVLIGADSGDSFNSDSMLRLQRAGDRVFMQFKTDADQNSGILFGDVDDDVECAIEYEPANKALTFSTGNNAEAIRIDTDGLVGIKESDATGYWGQANDLVIDTSGNGGITIKSTTSGNGRIAFTDTKSSTAGLNDGGLITYHHTDDDMSFQTNGTEAMRIDTNQKVGIGTASPLDALHVTSAVSTDYRGNLLLSDSTAIAAGVGGQLNFGGKYTGSTYTEWAGIQGTKENATDGQYGGQLEFKTRAHNAALTTKMTLDSTGTLKITQSSETGGQLLLRSNYSDPHFLATQGTNHSSGGWYWGYGAQMSGSGTVKSTFSNFSGGRSLVQLVGTRMEYSFADAQDTAIDSELTGLTESVRIDAHGIKFNGDTAAANALDDYEEGTWSASLRGTSGSAGAHAQSNVSAHYRKVGGLCFINAHFYLTNKGSYGGETTLVGLPFTNTGSTGQISLGSFPDSGYGTTSGNVLIAAAILSGGAEVRFYEGARLDGNHAYADVGTGYYVNIGGCYPVD